MSGFRKFTEIEEREQRNKIYGVCVAIVTTIKQEDDDKQGHRVKLKFPWLPNSENEESDWARVISMGAGKDRGFFCLPEKDDEVLVAFEHGHIARPYVIGNLWNGTDVSTYKNDSGADSGKNNIRAFKSRSGHILEFDDKKGEEKVTIKTQKGALMVIDDKALTITISDHAAENKTTIDNKNKKISIETTTGDILIKAKATIRLECKTFEVKTDADATFDVGANFKVKASSNFEVKGSGTGMVQSSGALTVKGSQVNIN